MSKEYCCAHCDYVTDRSYNLKRHIKKHQSGDINDRVLQQPTTDHVSQNVVLPSQNVVLPSQNVVLPSQNVVLPSQNVVLPSQNVTLCDDIETGNNNSQFKCETCYKTFAKEWCLKRHQPLCKGLENPNQCEKCLKVLSCRQNKRRHMLICKGLLSDESNQLVLPTQASTIVTNNNNTNSHNNNYDQCNVNNGNITNNNVTINLRCYGNENMDHITEAFKSARLQEFNGRGIVNLIKNVHFNPNVPENHNIRKYDKNLWKIFDNGDWMFKSFKSAIQDLIKRYKDDLCGHMFNPAFERSVACETTLQQIIANFYKFDMDQTPSHFYRCVRDITDLMENMEMKYQADTRVEAVEEK
jgi:hypothetical protein